MITIYLDFYRANKIDLKEFYAKYDSKIGYKLLSGAPLVISIEGTYIKVDDLTNLVVNRSKAYIVNQWITEIRNPRIQTNNHTELEFKWRR